MFAYVNKRSTTGFGPTEINVQPSSKFYDDQLMSIPVYSTHSRRRGAVLIINNVRYEGNLKERVNAGEDTKNLEALFSQIGMEIESHTNLTGEQMIEAIGRFKYSSKLQNVDMAFIIVMGHGYEDMYTASILGTNNVKITTAWIEDQFYDMNCEVLQDKPKIIMYQTCCEKMSTHEVDRHVGKGVRNMLIIHSTMQVDKPQCNTNVGNLYINHFCKAMMEHARHSHIEDVLKLVNEELSRVPNTELAMHTPSFTNINFKSCYIHPKIYLDDGRIRNLPSILQKC